MQKRAKKQAKPQNTVKEVQLSTNIAKHDMEVKANRAKDFIEHGDKVKVVLTMRGRELGRREESKRSLYEFLAMCDEYAVPEAMPKDEGNRCIAILKPKKK